jgi:hypothetical protein
MEGRPAGRPSSCIMMLALRILLGGLFTTLGVIGAIVPILPGWLFFGLAFLVLFPNSRLAVKVLDKVEPRAPRIVAMLRRMGIGRHGLRDTIRVR